MSDQNADVVAAVEYALVQIGLPAVEQLLAVYHNDGDDLSTSAESVLRDIFEDNQEGIVAMAVDVCAGVSQPGASVYNRYESEVHPIVVIDDDGEIHYWTNYVRWIGCHLPRKIWNWWLALRIGKTSCASMSVLLYWHRRSGAKYHAIAMK